MKKMQSTKNTKYVKNAQYEEYKIQRVLMKLAVIVASTSRLSNLMGANCSILFLVIAETKLDETFPTSQFIIDSYMKRYQYDRNKHEGSLLVSKARGVASRRVWEGITPSTFGDLVGKFRLNDFCL